MNRPRPALRALPLSPTLPRPPRGRPNLTLRASTGAALPRPVMAVAPQRVPSLLDATVDWGHYLDGQRQPVADFDDAVEAARAGEGFVWMGLYEPTVGQLADLGTVFDLHPLTIEDASNARQRPKLERYDECVVLALRSLSYVDREEREGATSGGDIVETGTIMVIVGTWFVVTVRHGRHAAMSTVRRRLDGDPDRLALGPGAVLHAIADKIVDDYLAVIDSVQEDIEEIENSVFAPRATTDVERIYQLKRDVIEMKRTVAPLAHPLHMLAERNLREVHEDIREYFRDVEDHLTRVSDTVANFDELLTSILEAGLARLTVAENEDMRKISAWVAIAAVPTMIAGVYGMNFEYMPELHQRWAYPVVMLTLVTVCGVLYRGFKKHRWL